MLNEQPQPPAPRGTILIALFGVVLPVITIVVELTQHLCAGEFFDPFPTLGHVFAILAVPVANAFAVRALWRRDGARLEAALFAEAVALAVAAVYALIFLPLTPLAVVMVVYAGLGLLPLTPLLAFLATLWGLLALRRLRAALGRSPRRTVRVGLLAGVSVLVAMQLPTAITRVLVAVAASDTPSVSHVGLHWLRKVGERDLLLRACYQRPSAVTDLLSVAVNTVAPVPPERMREIYYRVTGRPFDTEPRPRLGRSRAVEEDEWDQSQGGDVVGVRPSHGLSLASSRLDGSIDGRAALAYLEWTFELRNEALRPREARAEIVLPPGAVVSRVTLWIDGQEREAAFADRGVTRAAYQRVVQARRDPILVTTTAPDRVLVQCFPVPPHGGVMKARLGITAPLQLAAREAGTVSLPYFVQRNFEARVEHAVWLASKDGFVAPAPPFTVESAGAEQAIRARLPEPRQPGPLGAVTVRRPAALTVAWTADGDAIVRQTLRSQPLAAPARLIVVIDGSAAMDAVAPALEASLRALPKTVPLAIVVAGDERRDLLGGLTVDEARRASLSLRQISFEGGADSAPALLEASAEAAAIAGSAVLWIHGPQPVLLGPVAELRQRLERRVNGPVIYAYAATGGENRLLATLADRSGVRVVPRVRPGQDDLTRFLATLGGPQEEIVAVRERVQEGRPSDGVQTSEHLARLWARDRIEALLHGPSWREASDRIEALALASRYHLVTPVSGAVVLESASQFQASGLDPTDPTHVPTVPEPATWALLIVVALVLLMALRRRTPHAA